MVRLVLFHVKQVCLRPFVSDAGRRGVPFVRRAGSFPLGGPLPMFTPGDTFYALGYGKSASRRIEVVPGQPLASLYNCVRRENLW